VTRFNDDGKLHPLKGEIKEKYYAVVDLETKDGDTQNKGFTRPFLAGLYDGERYTSTAGNDCVLEMLTIMLTAKYDGWIYYAHNGGGFDWLHMVPHIVRMGYQVEILTVSSSIQMMHVKPEHRKSKGWMFLDSYKLIPMKLKEACETFRSEIQKLDFDLDTHEEDPLWDEYLEADCRSLFQVLERYHELVETKLRGEVGMTAASTAMRTFRRGYQANAIERHSEYHHFFRSAYFGGRCEIFRSSGEGLHYYDINSAYPWAMRHPLPVGNLVTHSSGYPSANIRRGRIGFVHARVNYPEHVEIPCLPVRDTRTKRLIFPVGKLQGYWCDEELERARSQGATTHYDDSIWIESRPDLTDYVDTLYAYRDKDREDYDEGLATVAKILLNSLYGKFAMEHEREKIIILGDEDMAPAGARPAQPKDLDCRVWHVKEEVDAPYIIPQISAYITCKARLKLHSYLLEAFERGVLCYCDTDSILTSADLSHLEHAGLGWLKDEGKGDTYSGEFLLPKLYCLLSESGGKTKIAMKGHRERSEELFQTVKRGETLTFPALEKIGGMAARGFASGPQMKIIKRQLKSSDEKRVYLDGGATKPLYIEMW
jgi:uncharacterized protein YfbU (UPF0304 family)